MSGAVTAVLYLLKDAVACVALLLIFRYIFANELKRARIASALLAAGYAVNAFAGNIYLPRVTEDYDLITDFVSNVLYILTVMLIIKGAKLSKAIWTVLLCICTVDMFYSIFSSVLPGGLIGEYIINIVFYAAICVWLYSVATNAQINFLPNVFDEIPKWVYAVLLLFELTCYYKEFGLSSRWYGVLYAVSSSAIILCLLYLVFKIFYMGHKQNQILRRLSEQKLFGESAVKGDDELRRFRHDYKNHMIVVSAFLKNGKAEEAEKYLASINADAGINETKIKTGNFVADAILNNKAQLAAEKGIEISFSGFIPPFGIGDGELSTIVSNLTDNAVEACEKLCGERLIEIEANVVNTFFVFSISNPADQEGSKGLFTTKPDAKNHGYGLKNVKRAVEKYNGVLVTGFDNGMFTVDLRLKLNNEKTGKEE